MDTLPLELVSIIYEYIIGIYFVETDYAGRQLIGYKNSKGLFEGTLLVVLPNGQVCKCFKYKNGLLHGKSRQWYPICKEKILIQRRLMPTKIKWWDPDESHEPIIPKLKSEINYINGKKHGFERVWNQSGILTFRRNHTFRCCGKLKCGMRCMASARFNNLRFCGKHKIT